MDMERVMDPWGTEALCIILMDMEALMAMVTWECTAWIVTLILDLGTTPKEGNNCIN